MHYAYITSDPAVQAAVAYQREAERLYVLNPDDKPDPQAFCATMAIIGFVRAGGSSEAIRNLLKQADGERRDRPQLSVVGGSSCRPS